MSRESKPACGCPFCGGQVTEDSALCTPCGVKVERCLKCGKPLPHDSKECPSCSPDRKPGNERSPK